METANIANVKQPSDLTGRVAIVTGGSVGRGRQIAEGPAETGEPRDRASQIRRR